MHSWKKTATCSDFEKIEGFFRKKNIYFSKTAKFWTFWELLLFQSHFTANLLQFIENKISRSEPWTNIVLVWTQLPNIG